MQDATSYQKLWEAKLRVEAIDAIKQGMEGIKQGQGTPAKKFFAEFFAKNKGSSQQS